MIERNAGGNIQELTISQAIRRGTSKAFDLRERPTHWAVGGAVTGGTVGAFLAGPLGAILGLAVGAASAEISVELAERQDRIQKRKSVQSQN